MIDVVKLNGQHVPFTDSAGNPISVPGERKLAADQPIQCRKCLLAWPCETRQLLDVIERLQQTSEPEEPRKPIGPNPDMVFTVAQIEGGKPISEVDWSELRDYLMSEIGIELDRKGLELSLSSYVIWPSVAEQMS